ncbi:hypothetical protein ACPUVO_12535 [Pseudocolwellia sp. HL-MZ19]|uniref:hypothetical protein n=1 Tax=unclassified Pseudocolwellia TaxID=2848178 RepID=UPI003CE8FD18
MYKNGLSLTLSLLIISLPLLVSSKVSAAKIYHCKTADGRLEIQDFACKGITLKVQDVLIPITTSAQNTTTKVSQSPVAIIEDTNVSTNKNALSKTGMKANIDDFYGMPIHPTALTKEITDTASLGVITLRYISTISSKAMVKYYQNQIPAEHNKINIRDTIMFTYEEDGINKLVSILDDQGIADVTIQVER